MGCCGLAEVPSNQEGGRADILDQAREAGSGLDKQFHKLPGRMSLTFMKLKGQARNEMDDTSWKLQPQRFGDPSFRRGAGTPEGGGAHSQSDGSEIHGRLFLGFGVKCD